MFSIAAKYCTFVHRASSMLNVFIMLYTFFFGILYQPLFNHLWCGAHIFLFHISYIVQFKIIIQLTFLEILASVVWGCFADNQGELLPGGAGLHGCR